MQGIHGPAFCHTAKAFTIVKGCNELTRDNAVKFDESGGDAAADFDALSLTEQQTLLKYMFKGIMGACGKRGEFTMAQGVLALVCKLDDICWPLADTFIDAVIAAAGSDEGLAGAASAAANGDCGAAHMSDARSMTHADTSAHVASAAHAPGQDAPRDDAQAGSPADLDAHELSRAARARALLVAGLPSVDEAARIELWTSTTGAFHSRVTLQSVMWC